jgi:peptide/nickel transport system substrate-binding protein
MAYATNRAELAAAGGGEAPLFTMITPIQLLSIASPAQVNALIKSLNTYPFSLAKAKAELAQSKVPNGFKTYFNCPPFGVQQCEAWAGQMAKIGIQIQVNAVDVLKYINEVYAPPFDYSFIYGYIPCNTDPNSCLSFSLGSAQLGQINTARWAPPDVDKLLNAGIATLNKAKRFAIYSQILKRIAQDVPYVPYTLPVYSIMIRNKYTFPGINKIHSEVPFSSPWILNLRPK